MIAESICLELNRRLKGSLKGKIHSVFKSAVNIVTDDNDFITLSTIDKPNAPNSIRIIGATSFLNYELMKDMKVSINNEYIWLENLNKKIKIDKAMLWDPSPTFSFTKEKEENVLVKLSMMEKYLLNSRSFFIPFFNILNERNTGFELFSDHVMDDKNFHFITDRFLKFMEAFIMESESISYESKGIIGYGIGLTPSMDDFICGLMSSKIYLFNYFNRNIDSSLRFNSLIVKDLSGITTRVSEEMLKFSAMGYVNEDVRNLLISLLSKSSIEHFQNSLKKVACFGFSSGTDIISGIYTCSTLFFNQ